METGLNRLRIDLDYALKRIQDLWDQCFFINESNKKNIQEINESIENLMDQIHKLQDSDYDD